MNVIELIYPENAQNIVDSIYQLMMPSTPSGILYPQFIIPATNSIRTVSRYLDLKKILLCSIHTIPAVRRQLQRSSIFYQASNMYAVTRVLYNTIGSRGVRFRQLVSLQSNPWNGREEINDKFSLIDLDYIMDG